MYISGVRNSYNYRRLTLTSFVDALRRRSLDIGCRFPGSSRMRRWDLVDSGCKSSPCFLISHLWYFRLVCLVYDFSCSRCALLRIAGRSLLFARRLSREVLREATHSRDNRDISQRSLQFLPLSCHSRNGQESFIRHIHIPNLI